MALQQIAGGGLFYPKTQFSSGAPGYGSSLLIDATGEKVALSGRVWYPSRASTKNISRVCFMFGAVTKASGSALTVSLQDVSVAAGPVMQPDGTQDQTVAVANADAAFLSNTWYRTGTLNTSRTVTYGDLLSVVIEYDGSGRLGADSVIINNFAAAASGQGWLTCLSALNTGGTWASNSGLPVVVLEFDDGTFGTLDGTFVFKAVNTHNHNVNTATSDEFAAVINVPFSCKVDGLWALVLGSASADFEMLLYSGTTALATISVDNHAIYAAGAARFILVPIPEQTLTANTDYYVSARPTTANNISVYSLDVADANHWTTQDGGTAIQYTTRLNQGAWAAKTATRRLYAGVRISSLDDGVGGAAGMLAIPNLDGV